MNRSVSSVGLVCSLIGVIAGSSSAEAAAQSKGQQKCINALNKAGAKVAATQGKQSAACVKNATKGKVADAQACLSADLKSKLSKAKLKTVVSEGKSCGEAPDFGRTSATVVNAAAEGEELALTADLFGTDLTAAIIAASSDKVGAGCQAAISKTYEKLAAVKMKTFLGCKQAGLKDTTIDSGVTLETACFDAIITDAKGKVAKTVAKLASSLAKKCSGVDLDLAFPGTCVGAGDFASCVDASVECHVCLTLDAMDGLVRDCDVFDNGVADLSCAVVPPTTTTTVPVTTTTLPPPDWGMGCFATTDCGAFCGGTSCQCDAFLESIGLSPSPTTAMCFFDCMDLGGTVVGCRAACGGPASAPACDTTTAGSGGFTGIVTGVGKCEPSGFAASVVLGGSAGEFKRLEITFTEAIDESTLFDAAPPPCDAACPPTCPPTAVVPLPEHFRLQMGSATPPPEACDRAGVAVSACKSGPTSYVIALDAPICSTLTVELSIFMSCHVGNGIGDFLHFSSGDFFAVGTWPP